MDCIGIRGFRDGDNPRDVEVRCNWPYAIAQVIGFIRFEPMQRELVLFGMNRNGADA